MGGGVGRDETAGVLEPPTLLPLVSSWLLSPMYPYYHMSRHSKRGW